jgi:hypothetical protein
MGQATPFKPIALVVEGARTRGYQLPAPTHGQPPGEAGKAIAATVSHAMTASEES